MRSKIAFAVFAALSSLAVTIAPTAVALGEYAVTTPGAYILSTAVDQNGNFKFCTAGFVVRTPDGAPHILTAGHCRQDPNSSAVRQRTPHADTYVGEYARWVVNRNVRDMAIVDVAPSSLPVNAALDGRPVVRVMNADDVRRENPVLCKSGARTGLSCGPVTEVNENIVSFRAWDDLGDSGSPVYAVQPDNTIAAVGILYAHSDDAQGRIIHATMVAPTMRDWGLSLW